MSVKFQLRLSTQLYDQVLKNEISSWSQDLAQNSLHAEDFASALYCAAKWAGSQPSREAILQAHSELLAPASTLARDLDLPEQSVNFANRAVEAAVFCAVDDGETTQLDIARVTEAVMGVRIGFQGKLIRWVEILPLVLSHRCGYTTDKARFRHRRLSQLLRQT